MSDAPLGRYHFLTWARRGIGTRLLERCEQEARARGFSEVELMATLPGVKLYAARGYAGSEMVRYEVGAGESIEFIPMRKILAGNPGDAGLTGAAGITGTAGVTDGGAG